MDVVFCEVLVANIDAERRYGGGEAGYVVIECAPRDGHFESKVECGCACCYTSLSMASLREILGDDALLLTMALDDDLCLIKI